FGPAPAARPGLAEIDGGCLNLMASLAPGPVGPGWLREAGPRRRDAARRRSARRLRHARG
ncbi:MAG TPA: hypothetical protein VIV12_23975, partial [Streptosporangiaceae bacterium]